MSCRLRGPRGRRLWKTRGSRARLRPRRPTGRCRIRARTTGGRGRGACVVARAAGLRYPFIVAAPRRGMGRARKAKRRNRGLAAREGRPGRCTLWLRATFGSLPWMRPHEGRIHGFIDRSLVPAKQYLLAAAGGSRTAAKISSTSSRHGLPARALRGRLLSSASRVRAQVWAGMKRIPINAVGKCDQLHRKPTLDGV